jgi:hypothetical protein
MTDSSSDLARFVRGDCDLASFPHREHLRMAFEMLRRHSFPETVLHYSQALRRMTARGGKPEAYHETVTVAFLSPIAERMDETSDFDRFLVLNPDLLDTRILTRWYDADRLASDRARRTFVLPAPPA